VPDVTDERAIRLAVDINVFVADILSRRQTQRSTAARKIVDAVRDGMCAAGPVQLITSLPIIENFADVLERRFGYSREDAAEKAWILEQYALEGPMPSRPYLPVATGYIPFETEEQLRQAIAAHSRPENADKLFNEVEDDRYVLATALAGRADIFVTCDLQDFCRGPAMRLQRTDVVLFPFAERTLVIGAPQFVAYWLGQGEVPDESFVARHPHDFAKCATNG
jgi:predicted nucleic acid-binding protein